MKHCQQDNLLKISKNKNASITQSNKAEGIITNANTYNDKIEIKDINVYGKTIEEHDIHKTIKIKHYSTNQ